MRDIPILFYLLQALLLDILRLTALLSDGLVEVGRNASLIATLRPKI